MAQIGVQYPALNQLFGPQSAMPAYYGTQQLMAAQESEKINQDQALQDMLFKAQDQPLNLQTKQAALDQSAALLPGYQADSFQKQRNADVRRGTSQQQEIETAAKQLFNQFKAEDIKMFDTETDMMLRSNDPREVTRGHQRAMLSRAIVQEQAKAQALADREQQRLEMQGRNSKDLMQMQIDAGRFKKSERAQKSESELVSKLGLEKSAVFYKHKADEALQEALPMEPGPERTALLAEATQYQQRADMALQEYQKAQLLRTQQGQAGKVDLGGMGVATNPAPQTGGFGGTPMGQNNPIAASPTNSASPEAKAAATFKQAFGSYEPDKYDYRISPEGKPQRKPK